MTNIHHLPLVAVLAAVLLSSLWFRPAIAAEGTDEPGAFESGANEHIVSRIEALNGGFPVEVLGSPLMAHKALPAFYANNGFRLAWESMEHRQQLADAIGRASDDGLLPGDYHADLLDSVASAPISGLAPARRADIDLLFSDAFLVFGSHLLEGKVNPQTIHAEWTANRRQRNMELVLASALESGDISATLDALRPAHPAYRQLMDVRRSLASGAPASWQSLADRPTLHPGDRDPRLPEIRHRLAALGDLEPANSTDEDPLLYNPSLEAAIMRFQARHGLEADGVVGRDTFKALNLTPAERIRKLDATLERWRWLPESLGETYVLVNIAGFELTLVEKGAEVLRKRVIVGKPFRQTPVFSDQIEYLVLNPNWTVPRSIMLKDQLPQILQDPDYLARLNISVYRGWGADRVPVDPATIDWTALGRNNFPYQLVQEPGPQNALGQVKFMLPNQYDVYLHDTPARGLFAKSERTFSSGCIRVEQPFDLAERLLSGSPDWSRARLEQAVSGQVSQTVLLPRPVPVHLQYWTAWVDNEGHIQYRNDIYDRDARLLKELKGSLEG